MSTTLPTSIQIGPCKYQVDIVRDLRSDSDEKLLGQIDYVNFVIHIDNKLNDQQTPFTLWHEIIHGILRNSCRGLKESVVDTLAFGIVDVLQRNDNGLINNGK
ncbi:MAG: hypothetical protein P4L50_03335 [Anaerolineaceae bacterium]|nr:hypothetical protein [Anaerolineaceae bacterium]